MTTAPAPVDQRVAEVMKEILADVPRRLDVRGIVTSAHERLTAAVPDIPHGILTERLAEVLQEIAACAVEEFTRRTGRLFEWHDEPEFELSEDNTIMSFRLDERGVVCFGEPPGT